MQGTNNGSMSPVTASTHRALAGAICFALIACINAASARAAEPPPFAGTERPKPKDPFKDLYARYRPGFLRQVWQERVFGRWRPSEKQMKLSTEPSFYTLNVIEQDARADALIRAGLAKELAGKHREALKMYQLVIGKYPQSLYRVSKYGVFVPARQYCQRRILGFPPEHLAHYRTLYDAAAKEAFELARRKNSLIGLSEVVDGMLATSYGGRAILELGNASLDTGHYLAALERYRTIYDYFPSPELRTPELELKAAIAAKMIGRQIRPRTAPLDSSLSKAQLALLRKVYASAKPEPKPFLSQKISPPHTTASDYTLLHPTVDPLALTPPTWSSALPGSRRGTYVYSQPVVTGNSVIYRHKNIVYCHSLLNGRFRWVSDLGGRTGWQNGRERLYPREDVLVQDGLVFAAMSKGGPSLVALDEVSGQLRWAYGPMVASTPEEARMRFMTAPAGGPRTVYIGYVLDNIEGDTHTDTEYGLIAFDSTTGRTRWRRPLCRLAPGKFTAGFAFSRRNRIRSFVTPPLYHQGTVYYGTNAGAIAAVDALSGEVKWLMRYPYYPSIHDATRVFKNGRMRLWYNQRPLLIGERLYILAVDSPFLLCLDRQTGKVLWSRRKAGYYWAYLVGQAATGELVVVYSGRDKKIWSVNHSAEPVHLLDPATGKSVWKSSDLMRHEDAPVLRHYIFASPAWCNINHQWTMTPVRPCLMRNGKLYVMTSCDVSVGRLPGMVVYNLTEVDLNTRKITNYRRFLTGELLAHAAMVKYGGGKYSAGADLKRLEAIPHPHRDKKIQDRIQVMKEIIAGEMPENEHGEFMPFLRVPVRRYGVPFELRFGPRKIEMVYDRAAVAKALAGDRSTESDFARAELAVADSRPAQAAKLLKGCLRSISSEDLDFRALINQQLYKVHRSLCRGAIRSASKDAELANALGMARTAGTLADEMEALFALSEAYARRGDLSHAARCLRSIISTYGHHEYPIAPAAASAPERFLSTAGGMLDKAGAYGSNSHYRKAFQRAVELSRRGLLVYLSTVSPLPKELTVRAGEFAAHRLIALQKRSPQLATTLGEQARAQLVNRPVEEQIHRVWEFPKTQAAQAVLTSLFADAAKRPTEERKRRMWRLADAARTCRLDVPDKYRAEVYAPELTRQTVALALPQKPRTVDLADAEGINWLALERRGDRSAHRHLLFLGGRVRKRLDNKFILAAFDLRTGRPAWRIERIRLKGTGQEAGFYHAFVLGDVVIVHGLYDVLGRNAKTGKELWRYRVPFNFEIKNSVMSGDLLVLCGTTETIALRITTRSPNGELVWQETERGDLYVPSYMVGDRVVSVRKNPSNVTVRFRATGKLIGRLDIPDLSLFTKHPLIENGPDALPWARHGKHLLVTDGWYYIMLDVKRLTTVWKRLIDSNDLTREPPLRFALSDDYLAVLKQDYDQKALHMLSAKTGEVLWRTDPKNANSPRPMHSMHIVGDRLYGIGLHPAQGFYFVARNCTTGKIIFRELIQGYVEKPSVRLVPRLHGRHAVIQIIDRQNIEVRVVDVTTGKSVYVLRSKGFKPFGEHGRVSATVQAGRAVLLTKDKLQL
jgi:outer membrane protein assembly factor BamB/tetratricopeptide (TPR) repeat protein